VSGNLALLRSRTSWACDDFYEEKTEVCVFGDEEGYRSLAGILRCVGDRYDAISVSYNAGHWGMALLLIHAPEPPVRAKVKICERITLKDRKPGMELVIYGNVKGFTRLAKMVDNLVITALNNPAEHCHVDDWHDRWVVKRSVSLNIRGPVSNWDKQHLGDYYALTRECGKHYLPHDIEHLFQSDLPYRVPVPGESPGLSLNDSHRP